MLREESGRSFLTEERDLLSRCLKYRLFIDVEVVVRLSNFKTYLRMSLTKDKNYLHSAIIEVIRILAETAVQDYLQEMENRNDHCESSKNDSSS